MKYIKQIFRTIILCLVVIAFPSCENLIDAESKISENKISNENTYLVININNTLPSRTVNPLTDVNELYNLKLTGKRGESNLSATTLATAASVSELNSIEIPIAAGVWSFTLTATMNYNGLGSSNFQATATANIEYGKTNTVSFTLSNTNSQNYGGVYVTINFSDDENFVNKVIATLKNSDKSASLGTETFSGTQITNNDSDYGRTVTYKKTIGSYGLQPGSYYLVFDFFADDGNGNDIPLNSLPTYLNIVKGFPSVAEFNIDINEIYQISYEYYEGTGAFFEDELTSLTFENNEVLPGFYSRNSPTYTLPTPNFPGAVFDAWYSDTDFEEEHKITQITKGTTGDLTLYAHFTESSSISVTRTNPEATLTPTSGTMIFEVSGLSNPEEPWNEVNVDIKSYDAGEDYWFTYDSDEGHNYSSDWDGNIFKLYLYSFSPDDQYKVVFYDSENNPLCSDYEFEFTVAELPVQTIDIGSLDSDGLTSAVQTAVEVFGSGKVKLAFTGTNSTNGVNLYNIVASALSNYQAAELDFSECSGSVVSEVPDNVFWNKFSGNGTIALSDSTTKLGSQAFAQNSTITVSNLINVTEIGEKAFYYNSTYSGLGDISLNNVTSIGNSAFGNCVIGTLYLGTSTSIEINSNAFYDSESSWNPNSTTIDVLNIGNFEGDVKTPFNKCNHIYKFEVSDTNTIYSTNSEGTKLLLKSDGTEYMSVK